MDGRSHVETLVGRREEGGRRCRAGVARHGRPVHCRYDCCRCTSPSAFRTSCCRIIVAFLSATERNPRGSVLVASPSRRSIIRAKQLWVQRLRPPVGRSLLRGGGGSLGGGGGGGAAAGGVGAPCCGWARRRHERLRRAEVDVETARFLGPARPKGRRWRWG